MADPETILAEQKEYYRARAPEYDDWWFRRGRYDGGADHTKAWNTEIAIVENALAEILPVETALELACGTGNWTRHLAAGVGRVTAVDTSPEVIAINRKHVAAGNVEYLEADLFQWQPTESYDVVFFGFWLSHIPSATFDEFWDKVAGCLTPGGRVFFVDSDWKKNAGLLGQPVVGSERRITEGEEMVQRTLADGRNFHIVKNYFEPEALMETLAAWGWRGWIKSSDNFFIHGSLSLTD